MEKVADAIQVNRIDVKNGFIKIYQHSEVPSLINISNIIGFSYYNNELHILTINYGYASGGGNYSQTHKSLIAFSCTQDEYIQLIDKLTE